MLLAFKGGHSGTCSADTSQLPRCAGCCNVGSASRRARRRRRRRCCCRRRNGHECRALTCSKGHIYRTLQLAIHAERLAKRAERPAFLSFHFAGCIVFPPRLLRKLGIKNTRIHIRTNIHPRAHAHPQHDSHLYFLLSSNSTT